MRNIPYYLACLTGRRNVERFIRMICVAYLHLLPNHYLNLTLSSGRMFSQTNTGLYLPPGGFFLCSYGSDHLLSIVSIPEEGKKEK